MIIFPPPVQYSNSQSPIILTTTIVAIRWDLQRLANGCSMVLVMDKLDKKCSSSSANMRCWISNNSPFSVLLLNLLQWKVCVGSLTAITLLCRFTSALFYVGSQPLVVFVVGVLYCLRGTSCDYCLQLFVANFLTRSCDRFCCFSCLVCMIFFAEFSPGGGVLLSYCEFVFC